MSLTDFTAAHEIASLFGGNSSTQPPSQFKASRVATAGCYARYSSDLQNEDSLDQQRRACREAAERQGLTIPDDQCFSDQAISGTKLDRDGLQRVAEAVAQGRIGTLFVYSLSRIARETAIAIPFVKTIVQRYGVRIVSVAEGIDSQQVGWEIALQMMSMVHEQFIRDLSAHVRRGQESAQRRGHSTGDYPFGYRSVVAPGYDATASSRRHKVPRVVQIDEEHARWVQLVFDLYVHEGQSIRQIAREMNRRSAPKDHRSTMSNWHSGIVRRIIANAKYAGRWSWGKTRVSRDPTTGRTTQVIQPPDEQQRWLSVRPELRIITDEQFLSAQRRLSEDRAACLRRRNGQLTGGATIAQGRKPRHLLSCLLRCGHCGEPFYAVGRNAQYLGCRRRIHGECECRTKLLRSRGERMILDTIGRAIAENTAWTESVVTATLAAWRVVRDTAAPRRQELQRQRSTLENKLARLLDMIEDGDAPEDVRLRAGQRRQELSRIDADLSELDRASTWSQAEPTREWIMEQLHSLDTLLSNPTPAACQALRRLVGGSIIVEQVVVPGKKRGFLRGRMTLDVPAALEVAGIIPQSVQVAEHLGALPTSPQEVVIDFVAPSAHSELADRAWALYQSGTRIKQIAAELEVNRNVLTKLLNATAARHGRRLVDGRARNGKIRQATGQQRRHEAIAEEVMELYDQGTLQDDIARRLGVGRDLVSRAIRHWHESGGLPVPDGRTRRKSLDVKSSRGQGRPVSDATDQPCE